MEENTSENPVRDGISLFSPDEEMELTTSFFQGQARMVPDLGPVYLWGSQGFEYGPDDIGITVIGNQIVTKPAQELQDMGLYDTNITLMGLPKSENPLLVTLRLKLSTQQLILQDNFSFGEDEPEENPEFHYSAQTDRWKKPGDQQGYIFFVPKDPAFLSRLSFSFSSTLQLI